MATADFRFAVIDWIVQQADDLALSIGWTSDGTRYSEGGTTLALGTAGNWSAKVWASREAASAGDDAILTATVAIPSSGLLQLTIADTDLDDIEPGTAYWWGAVRTTAGSRRTWCGGRFQVDPGVLTP